MAFYPKSANYSRSFYMVLANDHISPGVNLTCNANLSKAGGNFSAACGTVTEISAGWYKVALTTTDTNTAGDLAFDIQANTADPTDFTDQVLDPTTVLTGVNVIQWN